MSLARALEGYLVPLLWLLDVSAEDAPTGTPKRTAPANRLAEAALFVYDPARPSRSGHSIKCGEADRVEAPCPASQGWAA
jgi:hypothetical protein